MQFIYLIIPYSGSWLQWYPRYIVNLLRLNAQRFGCNHRYIKQYLVVLYICGCNVI